MEDVVDPTLSSNTVNNDHSDAPDKAPSTVLFSQSSSSTFSSSKAVDFPTQFKGYWKEFLLISITSTEGPWRETNFTWVGKLGLVSGMGCIAVKSGVVLSSTVAGQRIDLRICAGELHTLAR